MRITSITVLTTVNLFLFLIVSCNHASENTTDSSASIAATLPSAPAEMSDTMSIVNKDEKTEGPRWNTLSFASSQEAIDYMTSSADASKYTSGILPAIAEANLGYTTKLLNSPYKYFIIIDKEIMRVGVFDKYGREQFSCGIACARNYGTKHKKADSRTPEGFFSAEGVYDSTDWLYTDDFGHTSPAKGVYGPRFIRIANPVSSQIGLHGTSSPWSIGKRASHGCIRVNNNDIVQIVPYITPGMPIIISPSSRDQQVNKSEGVTVAKVSMDPEGKYAVSASAKEVKDIPKTTVAKSAVEVVKDSIGTTPLEDIPTPETPIKIEQPEQVSEQTEPASDI